MARARAPLLALLPALAGAGAHAVGEAALDQECAADMRVELLQKHAGAPGRAAALLSANRAGRASMTDHTKSLALTKSTLAVSSIHTGKSMAFKTFFLPVESEQEMEGAERDEFREIVANAIDIGAALPDTSEYSSQFYDNAAWKEDCGKGARVVMLSVLGEERDNDTDVYGHGMSMFALHGVYSEGMGGEGNGTDAPAGSSHREVGGLSVRYVERVYQEELGGLGQYSPWMDQHAALWDNDLDSYVHRFLAHGVAFLTLRWPAHVAASATSGLFYSLITHVPDTQEIFEIISATAPSDPRVTVQDFPMARHVFQESELRLLTASSGPTQLHVSRSHYDLEAVKAYYYRFFKLKPIHELRDADTGISFVSFWHQSTSVDEQGPSADVDAIRVQVMFWNRPDQSTTVSHTTEWLERTLEQINSQYMVGTPAASTACWPVWGDNHYALSKCPSDYFNSVRKQYDDAGIGYVVFKFQGYIFTAYFPLPGGTYVELQPYPYDVVADGDYPLWVGQNGKDGRESLYCFSFQCAA